jgi:uncharacterized protein (DUF736 family)
VQIGCFRVQGAGFIGRVQTLTFDVAIRLVPTGFVDNGQSPDWRLHLDDETRPDRVGTEVGAGWTHTRQTGDYMKIQLHCPSFPGPLRANLIPSTRDDNEHLLLWSPRPRRPEGA